MLATSLVLTLAAAAPTAEELLAESEAVLSPERFESDFTLTVARPDGEALSFAMNMVKSGDALCRVRVLNPVLGKGDEVLRDNGEEMWRYEPRIQRTVKVSSKGAFHSCDFSVADLFHKKLSKDYTPTLVATHDDSYELLLKAKTDRAAYDSIKYLLRKNDAMPLSQRFYTAAGTLVRTLEFADPQPFGGRMYPTRIVMQSPQAPEQNYELRVTALFVKPDSSQGQPEVATRAEAHNRPPRGTPVDGKPAIATHAAKRKTHKLCRVADASSPRVTVLAQRDL
jgi:outer membrane lipoprotein-sorting protein